MIAPGDMVSRDEVKRGVLSNNTGNVESRNRDMMNSGERRNKGYIIESGRSVNDRVNVNEKKSIIEIMRQVQKIIDHARMFEVSMLEKQLGIDNVMRGMNSVKEIDGKRMVAYDKYDGLKCGIKEVQTERDMSHKKTEDGKIDRALSESDDVMKDGMDVSVVCSRTDNRIEKVKNAELHRFLRQLLADNTVYLERMIDDRELSEVIDGSDRFFYWHLLLMLCVWRVNTQAFIVNYQAPYPACFAKLIYTRTVAAQICEYLKKCKNVVLPELLCQKLDEYSHVTITMNVAEGIQSGNEVIFRMYECSRKHVVVVMVDLIKQKYRCKVEHNHAL